MWGGEAYLFTWKVIAYSAGFIDDAHFGKVTRVFWNSVP